MTEPVTIYVCTKCRAVGEAPEPLDGRSGARLHAATMAASAGAPDIEVRAIECLSVCKRPVTVGFRAAGKWTYVYGDFAPEAAADLIACARLFGAAPDGLIPWKDRPDALKKGVVARLPPV